MFWHLIFICTTVSSSVNLLWDNDDEEEAAQLSDNQNKPKPKAKILIDRMRNRIKLFLKVRHQKPWYLIWLVVDFSTGFFLLYNSIIYGFFSETLISRFEERHIIIDIFEYYRFSRMIHKIGTLLLIEIYFFRIRSIKRNISSKNRRFEMIDETMTYFACLNLTLRAWLYIMGLTDAVQYRDRIHCADIKCSTHADCEAAIGRPTECKATDEKTNKFYHFQHIKSARVEERRQSSRRSHRHYYHGIGYKLRTAHAINSREIIPKRDLFGFDDDFEEINYQLKFPKQLLRKGSPHIMDLKTMRILLYLATCGTFIILLSFATLVRASVVVEFSHNQYSIILFLKKRLVPYSLSAVAIIILVLQFLDVSKFVLDCMVCYSKANHTFNLASQLIRLHYRHRKQIMNVFMIPRISNTSTTKNNQTKHNYKIDLCVGNVSENGQIGRQSPNECYRVSDNRKIDRLIMMIMELRSDFDHLKEYFNIYLNLELICKMPCVMLAIATFIQMPDLDNVQFQVLCVVFHAYSLPILYISYCAALIHSKVSIII